MKKMFSILLSLLVFVSALFGVFSAEAAEYKPDVELYSEAYMLINLDDDSFPVVAQKNQNQKMYPASLTKIVTAIVALNNVPDISVKTKVSREAYNILLGTGAQVAQLKIGEEISIEQLLYLTMVHSACDATEVLAEYVGGTRENFVKMMNDYAASIGCTGTHFTNPDGLHDDNHYSTAADMAKIALNAMQNEMFNKISTTVEYKYGKTNFYHSNLMLRSGYRSYYYKYAQGIKTGSTSEAGYCLVTKASKDGYNYLAVVMGAPVIDYNKDGYVEKCSFIDAASLFKWAFNSLKYSTLVEKNEVLEEIPVLNGKDIDTVQLIAKEDITTIVPASLDKSAIIIQPVEKPDSLSAPIKQGDYVCKANVIYGEQVIATVDLVAAKDVEISTFLKFTNSLKSFFSLIYVKVAIFVIIIAVLIYIILIIDNVNKKKRRKARRQSDDDDDDGDIAPPRKR